MFFDKRENGFVLRVRLTPNSCFCKTNGIFVSPDDGEYLKINVQSPPEKGKANAEVIKFLAKKLKIAKSDLQIISGELDRYKKIFITSNNDLEKQLLLLKGGDTTDECTDN